MRLELSAAHINWGAAWTCPSLDYTVHDSLHCDGFEQAETLHAATMFFFAALEKAAIHAKLTIYIGIWG